MLDDTRESSFTLKILSDNENFGLDRGKIATAISSWPLVLDGGKIISNAIWFVIRWSKNKNFSRSSLSLTLSQDTIYIFILYIFIQTTKLISAMHKYIRLRRLWWCGRDIQPICDLGNERNAFLYSFSSLPSMYIWKIYFSFFLFILATPSIYKCNCEKKKIFCSQSECYMHEYNAK